jgi:hypothetical protein
MQRGGSRSRRSILAASSEPRHSVFVGLGRPTAPSYTFTQLFHIFHTPETHERSPYRERQCQWFPDGAPE